MMHIAESIRALLACPRCHGELTECEGGTALACGACSLRYLIRGGIPVMLIDRAESLVH